MKLISDITVRLVQKMGGDHMIVAAAKVSTSGEAAIGWADTPADESYGLIRYLMKHRHGTPFEHSALTFFVHAPIFVFREWHRHRIGFSYNEASGRYKEMEPVFWVPRRYRKMVPADGHTSARPKFAEANSLEHDCVYRNLEESYEISWKSYKKILSAGIAKEVARAVLPVGIYSSCWVTCNPRSLMSFLSLRTHHPGAKYVSYPQAEIEEAAVACEAALDVGWPLTYKAFVECGRVAP